MPYNIDGIVITVNNVKTLSKLGISGKSLRGTRALKFSPKQVTTIIQDIKLQVGRTGAVTPLAILKPIEIEGVTITRATLHNEDEIKRLGVKIGDTVVLCDLSSGKSSSYTLVDPREANPTKGKISISSPIGKVLLDKKVGQQVEVNAPAGIFKYYIKDVQHL